VTWTVITAVPAAEPEQRQPAGRDFGLQMIGLGLGDLAGGERRVDLVLECLLQRRRELVRRDAELLRGVRHDRVALLLRGRLRRRHGRAGADREPRRCDGRGDPMCPASEHGVPPCGRLNCLTQKTTAA
jgi:hypothetical protein